MAQEKPEQIDEKSMILWGLLVVGTIILAPFGIGLIVGGSGNNSADSSCYDQVSQEITKREGKKSLDAEDVERYHSELTSRCR